MKCSCQETKSNLSVIKLLDQKNNLHEKQGTKGCFKLHHRDEINKTYKETNSAWTNNPVSSRNKLQGEKEERMKWSL